MILADSHCHLNLLDLSLFDNDISQVIARADANGVKYLLTVAVELEDHPQLISYAQQFEHVVTSIGLHPANAAETEPTYEQLVDLGSDPNVVAIGETGLDYYRSESMHQIQQQRFATHIAAAKALNKPLIIHTRQARKDTIDILRQEGADQVGGVMHCFTEDWAMAEQALELGFMISFSGIVTFKNARELQDIAQRVPLERMLIETDCPYLAPVPYRGKPNEPAYVLHVAEFIAELRGMSVEAVAEATTANYLRFIGRA